MIENRMDVDVALNLIFMIGGGIALIAAIILIATYLKRRIKKPQITHLGVDSSEFSEQLVDKYKNEKENNDLT